MKTTLQALSIFIMLISCAKETEPSLSSMLLTGISGGKGEEIVCLNIDSSSLINTTPINCHVFSSTVYVPGIDCYGYCSCDTTFYLVKPETGELVKAIKLPGFISQVVVDSKDSILIGRYTVMKYPDKKSLSLVELSGTGPPVYTDHVIRIDLSTGQILSDVEIDVGDGAWATTYFYYPGEGAYVLFRADNVLIFINPSTGEIIKENPVGMTLYNSVYDPVQNVLISLQYSSENQSNYLVIIDPDTGSLLASNILENEKGYWANMSGFDTETNCFIAVNSDFEVLFYDISNGATIRSYKLDAPLSDIQFCRR